MALLLKECISHLFSTERFFFDVMLRHPPNAWTISAFKPLLPSFAWWRCGVDCLVGLSYLPARSVETVVFGALTIVSCVAPVVGRDVACCNIWTTWRQAAYFMFRLVGLIGLNKPKSALWPSLHSEYSCWPYIKTWWLACNSYKILAMS